MHSKQDSDMIPADTELEITLRSLMSLKLIYFQSIFFIDFYIKILIYMHESGINFTKLLCSREFKRKKKLQ